MKKINWMMAILAMVGCFYSCTDDEVEQPEPISVGGIAFQTGEVTLPVKGRYYTLVVTVPENIPMTDLTVTTDAEWLELSADTIATDGIVEFFAPANEGVKGRNAVITAKTDNTGTEQVAVCHVRQKGEGDNDSNSSLADYFYVGWGYNIFNEYMSTNSVCEPILDNDKVAFLGEGKQFIQSVLKSQEETDYIVANSSYEMAELMTKKLDKSEKNIKGAKKTISRFEAKGNYEQENELYSYLALKRAVASSSMDFSMLQYLVAKGEDIFTDEFKKAYEKVVKNPTNVASVDAVLNKFGTHLIVSTELGGMMDLTVNFSRDVRGELNMRAEDFAGYFFKNEPSDFMEPAGNVQGVTSGIAVGSTFKMVGGSAIARKQIESNMKNGNSNGRVDPSSLAAWMESLDCSSLNDAAVLKHLAPISFRLVPVWSLFPTDIAGLFLSRVIEKSQQSNNNYNDHLKGIDYYAIPLQNTSIMDFGTENGSTLVRVVYASNGKGGSLQPVLEVCNEYVPVIRGDRRITVIYGVKNGRAYHGAGLFPGDGEGNPSAFLTFSDGDVYVKPVKGKDAFEKLDTVYYLHGNIYETNLGIPTSVPYRQEIKDQFLSLEGYDGQTESYPIVKIGSGYWTRKNIDLPMVFGEPENPDDEYSKFYVMEYMDNASLYANFFCGNQYDFMDENKDVYGNTEDKWYLPKIKDKNNLENYLGNNLKGLFNNQQTGFDAQFAGYYGRYDDLESGKDWNVYDIRYKNNYCFIAFKDNAHTGSVLVLTPDYMICSYNAVLARENYYPIRLYRSAMFRYVELRE